MQNSIILEPSSIQNDHPVPLCIVLHGNDSNPQAHAEFWRPLSVAGWLVVLPQSSRVGEQPNTFIVSAHKSWVKFEAVYGLMSATFRCGCDSMREPYVRGRKLCAVFVC